MIAPLLVGFLVLIGPLAVFTGVDSRLDDKRNGWPGKRANTDRSY